MDAYYLIDVKSALLHADFQDSFYYNTSFLMHYLDLSHPTPEMNLACDEVLLDLCEEGYDTEILRFWESSVYFVVLGYSNKVGAEVHEEYCRREKIPVLRRISGGGTVLQGPGCLNYSLILKISGERPIKSINETACYVLQKNKKAIDRFIPSPSKLAGITDLSLSEKKYSGNAQRRKKHFVLFHGTFLLDFELNRIQSALRMPQRIPEYRKNRLHEDFLVNLKLDREGIKESMKKVWAAESLLPSVPLSRITCLASEKYSNTGWNYKF